MFLYFGWFRKTMMSHGKLIYDPMCKGFHAIYGYLQVGKIEKINQMIFEDWSQYHPHVLRGSSAGDLDYLYTAVDYLSFSPEHKGYGVFDYTKSIVLTKNGYSKSKWQLPEFMQNYKISYHTEKSWKADYFQSAAKGQEFVMDCDDRIYGWLFPIFQDRDTYAPRGTCSVLFDNVPKQWGLRGDPMLWDALKESFREVIIPISTNDFVDKFKTFFNEITNCDFDISNDFYLEAFATGGMSSGMICMSFWRDEILPMLLDQVSDYS